MKNPIQQLYLDSTNELKFKENQVVRMLFDTSWKNGFGLKEISELDVSEDDKQQFVQLIGISIDSYGKLSFVDSDTLHVALTNYDDELPENKARVAALEIELSALRTALREPIARLYGIDRNVLK